MKIACNYYDLVVNSTVKRLKSRLSCSDANISGITHGTDEEGNN